MEPPRKPDDKPAEVIFLQPQRAEEDKFPEADPKYGWFLLTPFQRFKDWLKKIFGEKNGNQNQ